MTGVCSQRLSRYVRVVVAVSVVAMCRTDAPAQSPPPTQYAVTPIGALGGSTSAVYDIDFYGQMLVGSAQTSSGAVHAFAHGFVGLRDLGTLGGRDSVAFGVFGGSIAGQAQIASGQQRAFLADVSTGAMSDLGTLGGSWSAAYDLRPGIVVGASRIAGDARLQAFRVQSGVMSAVPVDRGGDSVAKAVNDAGDIVGYSCIAGNQSCRAFMFRSGTATYLGAATGKSVANGINEGGDVVGSMTAGSGTATHGFVFPAATMSMIELGTLGGSSSEALSINDDGTVVGTSRNSAGAPRAFIWRDAVMTDLNSLLPANSGWVLETATAISVGGQIVGNGLFQGVRRAFLLTPPSDAMLLIGGSVTEEDSNLPPGIEVGHHVRFVTSAMLGQSSQPITVYGAKMTHTLTGPAEVASVRVEAPDTCTVTPKTVTCMLFDIDSVGRGREIWVTVTSTGPGVFTHNVTLTSNVPDTHAENNTVTESNRAVALSNLTLTPDTIAGGKISAAEVTLTDLPPNGNAVVRMTSSRPDVVPLPTTFTVPAHGGTRTRTFHIIPKVVSTTTSVQITATYGLVSVTRTLMVVPPKLTQLYLTPTTVIGGCGTSFGKIVLTGSAPASGAVVPLTNTNAKANVPASVTVPAGTSSTTFSVSTPALTTPAYGTVTAKYGGVSQTLDFGVRPIRAKTLTLAPTTVRGGATVNGTIALECPAAPGAIAVSLTSSNAAVAAPTMPSITVPAGATSGSFVVRTSSVSANTPVTISVWVFGVRRMATLTITP